MEDFNIWRGLAVGVVIYVGYTFPQLRIPLLVLSIGVGVWVYIDGGFFLDL
jgi:membrane associated rhomboid family serine protease